ncbi:uncharacterized protein VTP21DRAFT_5139 [Calcarisporiella thermophila]|uniref:uncharacterized protein n=1 Tax=Calcarisporiella thermophila TaxID=911321 RepID=UPI003744462E
MSNAFCFSILRIVTIHVLQSAGFDSTTGSAANALTDVFARYLSLISQSASQYANLAGRDKPNALDVSYAFADLGIDLLELQSWALEGDGAALITENLFQSDEDPGQLLKGVLYSGREKDSTVEFSYVWRDLTEDDVLKMENESSEEESDDEVMSDSVSRVGIKEDCNGTSRWRRPPPAHVPSFLPPFPGEEIAGEKNEEEMKETHAENNGVEMPKAKAVTPAHKSVDQTPAPRSPRTQTPHRRDPYHSLKSFEESSLAQETTFPLLPMKRSKPSKPAQKPLRNGLTLEKDALEEAVASIVPASHPNTLASDIHLKKKARLFTSMQTVGPPDSLFKLGYDSSGMMDRIASPVALAQLKAAATSLGEPSPFPDGFKLPTGTTAPLRKSTSGPSITIKQPSKSLDQATTGGGRSTISITLPNSTSSTAPSGPVLASGPGSQSSAPNSTPKIRFRISVPSSEASAAMSAATHSVSSPLAAQADSLSSLKTTSYSKSPLASSTLSSSAPSDGAASSAFSLQPHSQHSSEKTSPVQQAEDIINCVCENPHMDDGTFMIACDRCQVWYHGRCVGVLSNLVDTWYCSRCTDRDNDMR